MADGGGAADPLVELARAGGDGDNLEALISELLEASSSGNEGLTHLVVLDGGGGPTGLRAPSLPPCLVLPGSFNPIHSGHEEMARRSAELAGHLPEASLFEICAVNADKGAVPVAQLLQRVEAIVARGHRVLLTRASLYFQKAAICRSCTFAIGYDTYRRIVDAKYYVPKGESLEDATADQRREWVLAALRVLADCGIRMVVAGRADGNDFKSLETDSLIELDGDLEGLFLPLPDFRQDISSTELRRQAAAAAEAAAADRQADAATAPVESAANADPGQGGA